MVPRQDMERSATVRMSTNGEDMETNRATILRKLADVREQIVHTESRYKRLIQHEISLMEDLNVVSSAILSLPVEIAADIFALACGLDEEPDFHSLPTPLSIGHTCRAWRRLAWSTPRLWQTIVICFSEARMERQRALFQEWLHRSAELGLHLYFAYEPVNNKVRPHWYYEPPEAFFKQILRTSKRWKTLHTDNSLHFSRAIGNTRDTCPFPILSHLRLHITDIQRDMHNDLNWTLGATPRLRSLDIRLFNPEMLQLTWDNVTYLKARMNVNFSTSFLRNCSSLKSCELWPDVESMSSLGTHLLPPPTAPASSANITSFSLSGTPRRVSYILSSISVPKLECLSIDLDLCERQDIDEVMEACLNALTNMLARSLCTLAELSLSGLLVHTASYLDILWPLTSLTRLSITLPRPSKITGEFIEALNLSVNPGFLPLLSEIALEGDLALSADVGVIMRMIRGRLDLLRSEGNPPIRRLEKLKVIYWNAAWAKKMDENPNRLAKFYLDLEALPSGETSVTWTWKDS
ncbi:hypothetical protein CPC08DRAFT_706152 [Agrocybe pediades]|nr:hypothetical protein CPC08DRAFT_706152 [Agrocybe pediades]